MAANLTLAQAFIRLRLEGESQVVSAVKAVNTQVSNAIKPMASLFEPAKESVLAFVKAASPQAFNTFNGSMQILSASIGKAFVPQIVEASKWIQDFAKWIRELDPETKKQIATWTGYGIAVLGATAAFTKLIGVLGILAAHPIVTALTVGITAVAMVVKLLNKELAEAAERVAAVAAAADRMRKGVYTEGEYNRSAASEIENDKGMTDEEKIKKAMELQEKIRLKTVALQQQAKGMGSLDNIGNSIKGMMGGVNPAREMETTNAIDVKESAMLGDLITRLDRKKGGPKFTDPKEIAKANGKGDFLIAGPNSGMPGGNGSSATSLENAFMQTAQAALSGDEIQREILKQTMENGQIFQKQAADINRMANGIERQQLP